MSQGQARQGDKGKRKMPHPIMWGGKGFNWRQEKLGQERGEKAP